VQDFIHGSYKLRLLIGGLLIVASLFVIPLLLAMVRSNNAQVEASPSASTALASPVADDYDTPNLVAGGMANMMNSLGETMSLAEYRLENGLTTVASMLSQGGGIVKDFAADGATGVAHGTWQGIRFVGSGLKSGTLFVLRIPGKTVGFVADKLSLSSIIRPADKVEVPVIDAQLAAVYSAPNNITSKDPNTPLATSPKQDALAIWPIHGQITTLFGVSDMPYQAVHTGMDISDGRRSGITPIKPFKAGRVVDVVSSRVGLGNHLVIDHGGGLSSVYGHLYSISVKVGQLVDTSTVLGYEGSTGASTGTHLHFEIRINGIPQDPKKFIPGLP
jgi:murein DD-endopeptidase MepM/ murein hydrolase activator NlpD